MRQAGAGLVIGDVVGLVSMTVAPAICAVTPGDDRAERQQLRGLRRVDQTVGDNEDRVPRRGSRWRVRM